MYLGDALRSVGVQISGDYILGEDITQCIVQKSSDLKIGVGC